MSDFLLKQVNQNNVTNDLLETIGQNSKKTQQSYKMNPYIEQSNLMVISKPIRSAKD